MIPEIYISQQAALPDKNQWTNRFEIHSETSDRVYVIAQHKDLKHWGCSCPAWRVHRKCKHLSSVGVPNYEQPFLVIVKTR